MTKKNLIIKRQEGDLIFKPLGGVSEIGATSYFIRWKGINILIDAGKRQGGKKLTPEYEDVNYEIDILFLTHIHHDHVGSLMEYYDFFNIKHIVATKETKAALLPKLKDSQKFTDETTEKYYSDQKIEKVIKKVIAFKHNEEIVLEGLPDIKFTLIRTSHLIGSCGVLIEDEEYSLFLTSDYTESEKLFHPKTYFEPVYDKHVDTVITETTYGSNEEGEEVLKETTLLNLENIINSIFNSSRGNGKGGNILIPAFASGRTQEVILAILSLIKQHRIPLTTKIRVPFRFNAPHLPLAQKFTKKYYKKYKYILEDELGETINDDFEGFVNKYLETIHTKNEADFFERQNQILIGAPGMLGSHKRKEGDDDRLGYAMKFALDIMQSKRHGIIFAGYQAPGTLGSKIQSLSYGESLKQYGKNYKRLTPHIYKVSFPGHVSAKGIISLVNKIQPENVILTHGDLKPSKNISKAIRTKDINVLIPEIKEEIYLMNNGSKSFFSTHHKYSNIVLSFEDIKNEIDYNKNILDNPGLTDEKVVTTINKIIERYDPRINHFYLIIRESDKNLEFYKKLEKELVAKGLSADTITVNLKANDKEFILSELLAVISETVLGFKEKVRLFFITKNYFYTMPYNILVQLFNEEIYYIDDSLSLTQMPNLPVDIDERRYKRYKSIIKSKQKSIFTNKGHNRYIQSDFYEVFDRAHFYKKGSRRGTFVGVLPDQLPIYDKRSVLFKKDFFVKTDKTLWGPVSSIYNIKNSLAVNLLIKISDKLNERIESIEFSNYFTTYDYNKNYGEVVAYEKDKIFYKMVLENGVQYLTINLRFNVNVRQCIKEIGLKN